MQNLKDKRAVVTGGGSGIGRAIALRFALAGAWVTILDFSEKAGNEVVEEIEKSGGKARAVTCDVSRIESVRSAFADLDHLDILVNNAGIAHVGTVEQTTPDDLDRVYTVNVKGIYHCLHIGVPMMVSSGKGVILNLASIASKIGIQDRFAYSMSKGAVLAMTLSVARDYVAKGVRCNCLCPARIHTPFVDGFLEKNYPESKAEMFEKLSNYQPIGRMGTPEEVAALAHFLCSDEAAFLTGSAYDIDGGVIHLR